MLARTQTRFHEIRTRLETYTPPPKWLWLWEFLLFGFKQAWACLFGGLLLALLITTKFCWPPNTGLARYDFLFLCALAIQLALLALRMESLREAKVILIFHVVGTLMELFKTDVGSWTYPGDNLFRIGGVPLFSGFMYAAVGSYLARVNRTFDFRFTHYPPRPFPALVAVLIYLNFFTHHYVADIRWGLFAGIAWLYRQTWVFYRPYKVHRRMPLLLGFALVALFIWLAENIGTFTTIWVYPHQYDGWEMVRWGKYGSWFLLMIVSFILVSFVHPPREPDAKP